jgi:hypothetical protein
MNSQGDTEQKEQHWSYHNPQLLLCSSVDIMKQLNYELKPVYKVGFIREKGKATARKVQQAWKPVARCTGEGWGFYRCFNSGLGGFFSLAFSGELVWFTPLLGRGNNLGSIFLISPVADLSDPVSFL